MDWADMTTYLGVIMQSNLKFDQHMGLKNDKALKTLGAIKHILKQAPQEGRLLAYTSLCRPILEYADTVWDPTLAKEIESMEMLQHRAVQLIARLRGRESVTEACSKQKRRNHRLSLLMKILQDEKRYLTLSVAYDEITGDHQKVTMTTRSAARGEITSVYAASHVYLLW